jgi:23S rRNA pseudouridine1911/1915/1917 synthase
MCCKPPFDAAGSVKKMKSDYRDAPPLDDEADESQDDLPETRELVVGKDQHGQRLGQGAGDFGTRVFAQPLAGFGGGGPCACQPTGRHHAFTQVGAGATGGGGPGAHRTKFGLSRRSDVTVPVVFEDEHLIVVNKPAGLVVHPAAGNWSGTLLNGLLAHHAGAAVLPRAGIVHRLDKDTSGLMVVGKTLVAVTALVRAIAAREVHREYLTLVHGEFPARVSSIDTPVGRDPKSRIRMAAIASGKPARTDVQRLACTAGVSALRCVLHSGRTHQIRVHLSHLGHPLVGDAVYGGKPALGMERQALHATALRFVHPVSGDMLVFSADPPVDFALAWAQVVGTARVP